MRWIAREPSGDRIMVGLLWAAMTGLLLFTPPHELFNEPAWSQAIVIVLLAITLLAMVGITLWIFFTCATIEDETLTLYGLRPTERLRVPREAVIGYHADKAGSWWIHTRHEETTCTDPAARTRIAVREPWEMHRAFVEIAPKKLGGRRWRFPGVPPTEEFRNLWTFDVEAFVNRALPQIAGVMIVALLGLLFVHRHNYAVLGQLMGLLLIPLSQAWARIDVTSEGIVHRSPFHRRTVPWSDAKAVFREGGPIKRSFVIVGPDCAIHLPAHLAIDRELMEKVLYSLPDPILSVNFDETTLKGFKRREKAKNKVAQEDLLPVLIA